MDGNRANTIYQLINEDRKMSLSQNSPRGVLPANPPPGSEAAEAGAKPLLWSCPKCGQLAPACDGRHPDASRPSPERLAIRMPATVEADGSR
jgi:hypothetical protein